MANATGHGHLLPPPHRPSRQAGLIALSTWGTFTGMSAPAPGPPSPSDGPGSAWRWPPVGARSHTVRIQESCDGSGQLTYRHTGQAPERRQLRALLWLLDEHPREPAGALGAAGPVDVCLGVAVTPLPAGRVGHLYALGGAPLSAYGRDQERGVLWRWVCAQLGALAD